MSSKTVRQKLIDLQQVRVFDRQDLLDLGMTPFAITRESGAGRITRLRKGYYVIGEVPADVTTAVTLGGRIGCITLLHAVGVFVLTPAVTPHLHLPPDLSRSRKRRPQDAVLHWTRADADARRHVVSIADAVRQSVRCQRPREAIATIDSALHHRLLSEDRLAEVFRSLPARHRPLLGLVDGSAESGPETFLRLILRAIGCTYETQVHIPGVGRVDFVVDGWLIIECDSKEHHSGWDGQVRDRERDLTAAGLGYVTIRFLATDIFDRQDEVRERIAAVRDALGPRLTRVQASQLRKKRSRVAGKRR